jgi:hypothetical protein
MLSQEAVQTFLSTLKVQHLFKQIKFSYFTFDALNFLLTKSLIRPHSQLFSFQCSRPWVREPTFHPGACMINVWACNLYDELALRGVTCGHGPCMMKQESWFLPKLYNKNFLSDGHCVTHKSWVQDALRRVCPDANNDSIYNIRTGSIHYMNMYRFSTWSQKGPILSSDDLRKDSIGELQEMIKVRIPTITKQTLRYELGVSRIWTLTNSHRTDC